MTDPHAPDKLASRREGFAAAGPECRAHVLADMSRDDPLFGEFQEMVLREQNKRGRNDG